MKVFANIDALENEQPPYNALSEKEVGVLCNELRRVIRDLIPLRKSEKATSEYYRRYLCPEDRHQSALNWKRIQSQLVPSVAEKYSIEEYKPSRKEVSFPEEIFHQALIRVLADDRYSFGYLYWLLCSRYNRVAETEVYKDIIVTDKAVEYAVDFDIDELYERFNALDAVDRMDYLEIRLIESKRFDVEGGGAQLKILKKRFEDVAEYIKDIAQKRLSYLDQSLSHPSSHVKAVPQYVDSTEFIESGQSSYLTFYNFKACSVDVSQYPFSLPLERYKVTRTEKGLEDASHILVDILHNVYKQVGFARNEAADEIISDTKKLLRDLNWSFYADCLNYWGEDFEEIHRLAKLWSVNTIKCLVSAFQNDVLPKPLPAFGDTSIPNYRSEVWRRCNLFRKTISEYCLYLAMNMLRQVNFNPYHEIYSVIPFNYYGADYTTVVSAAKKKRLKTEKDREATDFLANCSKLRPYLENRLAALDGKGVSDPDSVNERRQIVSDLIEMADSYLTHLEDQGVTGRKALEYAFDLWVWLVRGTIDYIIKINFSETSRLLNQVDSDEEAERLNNTGRQYVSFHHMFNSQMVQVQRDFRASLAQSKPVNTVTPLTTEDIEPITIEAIDRIIQSVMPGLLESKPSGQNNDDAPGYYKFNGITDDDLKQVYACICGYQKGGKFIDGVRKEVTESDFVDCIKSAKMCRVFVRGNMTRIKYAIKILKDYAENGWLDAVCEDLGLSAEEATGSNGYHFSDDYEAKFPIKQRKIGDA